jgi:kynureninase
VDLAGAGADFAVGCGYKYLNGGPGAPAFIYCKPELAERAAPALAGWMGHEAPFQFDTDYRPGEGIARMRIGTPPILSMAALDAALDVWEGVDIAVVRERSMELSEFFIAQVEARCPLLELASPRAPQQRGSQVSFRFAHGYSAMQALVANGVIGDFRAPDLMRFGFTPLYIGFDEVAEAVERLETVMRNELWSRPEFARRAKVT